MIQRCITGAVLVALLAGVLFVGSWLVAVAAFLCLSLALYEELTALSRGGHYPVWWTSFAGLAISVPLMMFYSSLVIIPILALLSFIVLLVVMRRENPDLVDICMSELPMLTVVLPGMCLFGILDTEPRSLQALLLVLVFAIAVGGDTFAYFVGSAIGGPKLCPHISPNKTVAGAAGGLVGSILCAVAAGRIFTLCFPDFSASRPFGPICCAACLAALPDKWGTCLPAWSNATARSRISAISFPGTAACWTAWTASFLPPSSSIPIV